MSVSLGPLVTTTELAAALAAEAPVVVLVIRDDGRILVALFDGSWEAWSTRNDPHPG